MTVVEFFPLPFLLSLGLLVLILILLWALGRKPLYLFCFAVFWFYLMFVASMTLFPIPLDKSIFDPESRDSVVDILSRINWRLLYFGHASFFDLSPQVFFTQVLGNILLTIPFGLGIRLILRFKAWLIPLLALGVGLGIEASQLAISLLLGVCYRSVDINDVLLNACGVLVGYILYCICAWIYSAISRVGVAKKIKAS